MGKAKDIYKREVIGEYFDLISESPQGENMVDIFIFQNKLGAFFEKIYDMAYSNGQFDKENEIINNGNLKRKK